MYYYRVIADDGIVSLIMDESYEHELWYDSEETGLMIIIHFTHPQLLPGDGGL